MSRTLLLLPVLALAVGISTVPVVPATAQCQLCSIHVEPPPRIASLE